MGLTRILHMKKNVIAILVDSLFVDCLSTGRTKVTSSPFIDELKEHSIYASNVYSFAPYTDAATKGLFCSMPTLSEFGYYFGINGSSINPYKVFKENDYETFGVYYPYYMTSPKIEQYIDHSIYSTGFVYFGTWRGQFDYYAELKEKRPLTSDEWLVIKKCVELMFASWKVYYNNVLNRTESNAILNTILQGPSEVVEEANEKLENENAKFKSNPEQYIDSLLKLGMKHPIASIDPYNINLFVDHDFLKLVYKENSELLKTAQSKNFWCNVKNNRFSITKTLQGICDYIRTGDLYDLKYPVNFLLGLNTVRAAQNRSFKADWQYKASARKQVEVAVASLKKRNTNKPFYAFLHFLEVHQNINFFSFDIKDNNKVRDEFNYMKPMIEGIDDNFVGSVGYQMAINYTDYCIKILFDNLKEMGLYDNTVVIIYADHGSSYTYYPVRKRTVNCFHRENYNIPVIIWDKDITEIKEYQHMYTSADIYTTLYDYMGFEVKDKLHGRSMLKNNSGREYVITEYMGPGCPDMFTRDVWLSIRNQQYMICYKSKICDAFDRKHPHQIFELKNDPLEQVNLARKVNLDLPEIKSLIDLLQNRFDEIKKERDEFITLIRKGKLVFEADH